MLKKLHSERLFQYCIPCILIACSVSHLLQAYCKFPLTFVPFMVQCFGRDWLKRQVLVLDTFRKVLGFQDKANTRNTDVNLQLETVLLCSLLFPTDNNNK